MFKIDLSIDDDYHSQINNVFIPYEACNTTSAIMWLKTAKVDFWYPKVRQPEDYLTAILNGKQAWQLFKKEFPDHYNMGMLPQYLSKMLEWGINIMVGKEVDHFIEDGSFELVVWELLKKRPVIMSGSFTPSGHFVVVVGVHSMQNKKDIEFVEDVDKSQITDFVVDDPAGNYYNDYKSSSGNGVLFSRDKFDLLTNLPKGRKWMHCINPLAYRGIL